ncbi:MAG: manganese efflux pump [Clostridiales bacterium]|nr:manganese efflux pump [Clostridiales bacterium]
MNGGWYLVLQFLLNSVLLGVGLAMDAFSISVANGIIEPDMKKSRMIKIAGVYAFAQFLMPVTGWFLVTTVAEIFAAFHKLIPWIALILLLFIGGKMVFEGIRDRKHGDKKDDTKEKGTAKLTWGALIVQGIATSIDALSVGFTIADYTVWRAFAASLIIGTVTLVICLLGLIFGKKIGGRFVSTATIIGGAILILIGIEIFVKGFFGL